MIRILQFKRKEKIISSNFWIKIAGNNLFLSFELKKGKDYFQQLLDKNCDFLDYKLGVLRKVYDIEAIEDKMDVEEAKKAPADIKKHGTISWEKIKEELHK